MIELVGLIAIQRRCTPDEAIESIAQLVLRGTAPRVRRGRPIAEFVARLKRLRLRRNQLMGAPLFRDPAWDMLLELFVAHETGRKLSVSSLCYSSGVPPTTALRQLARLEKHGFVKREGDQTDNRRCFVLATPKTIAGIATIAADASLLVEQSLGIEALDPPEVAPPGIPQDKSRISGA